MLKAFMLVVGIMVVGIDSFAQSQIQELIGLKFPPLPPGYKMIAGYAPGGLEGRYSFDIIEYNKKRMWWVAYFTRDQSGVAHNQITYAIEQPLIPLNYGVSLGTCYANKIKLDFAIAIVKNEDKDWLDNVKEAWLLDDKKGILVPYQTHGLRCEGDFLMVE